MRSISAATRLTAPRQGTNAIDIGIPLHRDSESPIHLTHAPHALRYPELIAVKIGDQFRVVEVKDIDWIAAAGNYVTIHVESAQRLVHKSLAELEGQLFDPARFLRIHRSTIVNLSRVATIEPLFHGTLSVTLKNGTKLECSRRYRARLQARVYFMS